MASARDPNAMGVDATTTTRKFSNDFNRMMRGQCYGCGSKEHRKAEGHHEQDICSHCGLTGHVAAVCCRKFLGIQVQKPLCAAATTTTLESTPTMSVAATLDLTSVLQQLTANQQTLAAQIAELRQNF
ncbi:hypothetical protein BT96DRAFT_996867 [Gymnopus androsaceus JB14]|uniref:CCHC-type domain-containing protein n=1 Tax=Gymnopus androsaceus JB14 TaxID=1447944 RepID=A0A6A4HGB2_9AGAR|nr:hypothetical protein BT96DRAFT_996867 [Gymnopus androsaceus JB14]